MKKVLCIDKLWVNVPKNKKRPVFMGTYNVDDERPYLSFGIYYHLVEFKRDDWWNSAKFIPLSDIDETEMVREKVNHPTLELVNK